MILVLGTGRSGTSQVAKILHEDLGVFMGHQFQMPDKFNPEGVFEDREFQDINLRFTMMGLNEHDNEEAWKLWREQFDELLSQRHEPWGLKDPGIADFPRLLMQYLALNPSIILCTRAREDTISSFKRMKGLSRPEAERIIDNRLRNIHNEVTEYLEIDCYDEEKEQKILEWYGSQKHDHI